MPPTIVLIRHAQALHNIQSYHALPDPDLSDLGRQQAAELREHLKVHLPADRKVQLIVVSPMRRAIQTCLIALDWLIDSGVPVVPDARWQELYPKPCDTGTPAPQLAAEFPLIDFSGLDPVYPDKTSPAGAQYAYAKEAILARGQSALGDLYKRSEDVIVVVSHSGFMRTAVAGRWFANADYRVFDFVDRQREGVEDDEPYRLVEWELTKGKGGLGTSNDAEVGFGEDLPGL
ncbi:phosphoglycerate mutase-like protein 1 [Chaetomidium leptoderma]|uniref:Phosphoglycerate mutase-like protein 1 n=1 Tax=Chaetomidium leptoderma TaxID=669021 RepID=A0AAN6VC81_9PEZI|nr:phosphoglycerate mutase-like protein 1 [Chaetomidium leptoderma]